MSISIGAHVDQTDPIAEAKARQAPLVQFFLGDPQGYKGPEFRYAGGAEGLRADAEAAGIDLYVHAPYIVNVATTNNRIRIPSRKLLQQHVDAAASIGAKGLIVHGGHVNKDDDPEKGFDNWRKADRGHRPQAAAAHREHRRRRQRDDPLPRADRRGVGRDLRRPSRPTWSGSASTPATPTPAATPSRRSSRTSGGSPGGSTWSTATTAATTSTPAPTGTPTSAPAGSTPTCWPRWSATPAPRSSARPRAGPTSTAPTSPGCGSGCRPQRAAQGAPRAR